MPLIHNISILKLFTNSLENRLSKTTALKRNMNFVEQILARPVQKNMLKRDSKKNMRGER